LPEKILSPTRMCGSSIGHESDSSKSIVIASSSIRVNQKPAPRDNPFRYADDRERSEYVVAVNVAICQAGTTKIARPFRNVEALIDTLVFSMLLYL
jgi:hypothetical protein